MPEATVVKTPAASAVELNNASQSGGEPKLQQSGKRAAAAAPLGDVRLPGHVSSGASVLYRQFAGCVVNQAMCSVTVSFHPRSRSRTRSCPQL